ncbi:enoyl-CoA hydratase/isomerase family protein [Acidiferrimicrobium sp. IK]|uniref:enoyl-CoA hydratase/isomerase family protein n=1 Tax=Acidiferrimicrobium sp. IK TaxID=2871700 RepID=UPI0021CAE5FE|nr:enoyl-CoA hydratase/isomerase family protein [Acidiferrimicrobium sp. IK]MCU4183885.1 enoyl-CoA hydratase/isomerase family protein [Acidiferrimicrobium sp. IK]
MTGNDFTLVRQIPVNDVGATLGLVTLNRPTEMNPLDWDTAKALGRIFDQLAADPAVRVIAVTGSGRSFSAGGDMKKYQVLQRDARDFPQFLEDIQNMFSRIFLLPKPVMALVNGIAVAGGIELVLSCDLAIASESARIGDAHLPFGQMGGGGVLTLLPRAVGPARARELIFSGRLLSPAEALDWGLVSQVVPDGELLDAGIAFAAEVAKKSPLAVANAKSVLNTALRDGTGISSGMRLEREVTARYCLTSEDAHEGLLAFADKRKPAFTGR